MNCPRCAAALQRAVEELPGRRLELDFCPACRGVWFDALELAALLRLGNARSFRGDSPLLGAASPPQAGCPRCEQPLLCERPLAQGGLAAPEVRIDQCSGCEGVWLDGGELQEVAARTAAAAPAFTRDAAATLTGRAAFVFMALTGMPLEQWNPRHRRPLVVGALIAACALAFLWQLSVGLDVSVSRYGLVPAGWRGSPLTVLTHLFLHAGLVHFLGNLYFFWTFGDNVEDRLGHLRTLLLYLLSGLGAAALQCALTTDPTVPIVGASGAISGILSAYAVLFPRTRLRAVLVFLKVRLPAVAYLGIWFCLQLFGALNGDGGIAWWAHIGGFSMGAVLALLWRRRGRP